MADLQSAPVYMPEGRNPFWHPYQKRYIPVGKDNAVEMLIDSWLQCQIERNLVLMIEVKDAVKTTVGTVVKPDIKGKINADSD